MRRYFNKIIFFNNIIFQIVWKNNIVKINIIHNKSHIFNYIL